MGVANLSQIIYGSFDNAFLGYYVSVEYACQGLMLEGIYLAIDHAFHHLNLHRIEANIQPANLPSIKLVQRLGWEHPNHASRIVKLLRR